MPVYVDNASIGYGRMKMCHMIGDTLRELHEMADKIGIQRKWFQDHDTPHYDICMSKRKLAIKFGAVAADRKKIVELIRSWRLRKTEHGFADPREHIGQATTFTGQIEPREKDATNDRTE